MIYNSLIFVTVVSSLKFSNGNPIVQLPNGPVLGRTSVTFENRTFHAFQGIPYAAPPIGPLRFKSPQPPQNWDYVLNATQFQTACVQTLAPVAAESEDCLFVNVYTPQLPQEKNASFPVMFYIHGGGFSDKSSLDFGPDLFINNDVILVTFNYRLGIFGFLSTQDDVIPGNYGLKDQQLALQWTSSNIHVFGGDPSRITIFGESAGSASVSYHLLNQKSSGLFQGAILESGTCLSPWAFQRRPREIAFAAASFVNSTFSTSNDSRVLLEFLRNADTETLKHAAVLYKLLNNDVENMEISQGFFWAPVIEPETSDSFLTEKMYGLLKTGDFAQVPVMMGINSEESLIFNLVPDIFKITATLYDEHLDWLVPNDMQIHEQSDREAMGHLIRDLYTGGEPFSERLGDGIRYSSDTSFTRSVIKYGELVSKFTETYFYQFSYDGEISPFHVIYEGAETVSHGSGVYYLFCFGDECDDSKYPEADGTTRKRLIKFWTDFAKFQNPTPQVSVLLQNITWPTVSTDSGNFYYMDIGENLEIKNHPKEGTYRGWNELYDRLDNDDFDTY